MDKFLGKTATLPGLGQTTLLSFAGMHDGDAFFIGTDPTRPGGKLTLNLADLATRQHDTLKLDADSYLTLIRASTKCSRCQS